MLADVLRTLPTDVGAASGFRLVPALVKHMPESRDMDPPTVDTAFRMSGMAKFCPRMYALAMRDGTPVGEHVDAEKRWIFSTGNAVHRIFQDELLHELGDVFQGWWRCRRCALVHRGAEMPASCLLSHKWIPRPKSCQGCLDLFEVVGRDDDPTDHDEYDYVELEFESKEYRITGHSDGVLDWRAYASDPTDLVELLEIKTIGAKGAPWVDSRLGKPPMKAHVIQAQAYLWGVEGTEISQTRILYVEKSFERPMLDVCFEHVVERNPDYAEALKRALKRTIHVLKKVDEWQKLSFDDPRRLDLELPDRLPLCRRLSDYRTKRCPVRKPCFR